MKSPRILIVRLSAIGDAIQTMPVACALRERFPDAFLAWAVESRAAALLRGHEALDELIELPRGWLKSPGGVWRLRRRLRDLQFDTAIDVQSLTKSAILAWLSGAKRRIGFGNPGGRELSKWFNNQRVDPKATHVVDRYLELLRPLGIESPAVRFQVPEHEADRAAAERDDRRIGNRRRVCDHQSRSGLAVETLARPIATRPWHVTWATLGICRRWSFGPARPSGRWPSRSPTPRARRFTLLRRPRFPNWPPSAARAKLFIGSDTGPLHLAAAVGTPCVGLYGPWPASRHGPYGPQHIALQKMFFEGSARARRTAPRDLHGEHHDGDGLRGVRQDHVMQRRPMPQ